MNRKRLLVVVSIGLLVLDGFLFYSAYQLWSRYNEALDHFRSIAPHPPIFLIARPDLTYVSYEYSYWNFFIPTMIGATVTSAITATLIVYQTGKMKKTFAIIVIMIALVIGSVNSLYNAYQVWSRYREASQTFYMSVSIPWAFYIEDYEKFFVPYTVAGVFSVLSAITLFHILRSEKCEPAFAKNQKEFYKSITYGENSS